MSEKLTPQVGDRVRLVHTSGVEQILEVSAIDSERIVTTQSSMRDGKWTGVSDSFRFSSGWSIAEIFPKPLPPVGTFLRGYMVEDEKFYGVMAADGRLRYHLEDSLAYECDLSEVTSWEVIP